MVAKKRISVAATILIMVVAFPFSAIAQTKHISKWFVKNYQFDFLTNPVTISQLEEPFYDKTNRNRNVYFDADGRVRLVQVGFTLYDGDGNEIKYEDGEPSVNFSHFIPLPNNDNIICGIGGGALYKIDIEKNEIISVENINFTNFRAVHNADCSGVWLFWTDGYSIKRQLLTSDGIKEAYSTPLNNVGTQNASCNLSWDCKYYTWSDYVCDNLCEHVVYFGVFDRRTATFRQTAMHNFGGKVYKGVFAPDNSKVYFSIQQNGEKIVEVPIVDDVPDFNRMRTICQFNYSPPHLLSSVHFGLDGRLYVFDMDKVHVIEFFDDGQFKVTKNFLTLEGNSYSHGFGSYLFDWYSDDPCFGSPCPDMPAPVIIAE
jgi:hypothetical protein